MTHLSIIFSLIAIAAGMALAYANKLPNGRQTRTVRSEVRIHSRRSTRK